MITFFITILALLSYVFGLRAVIIGEYKPSIYSRVIWSLISINSFFGVLALHNNIGIIMLSGVQLIGSMAILIASIKYSVRTFGKIEIISSVLLVISLIVWLAAKSPIINVLISLMAHFIGGIPTLGSVWKKPKSENFPFWFFFALASVLAYIAADKADFRGFVYAFYFLIFDGIITILASRQFLRRFNY